MTDKYPPRGVPHYKIYCPDCKRQGVMAGWTYAMTGEPVPPEKLSCPECGSRVEVLGRADQ
jgi:hypothetical protein